jgi:hypothetical protein
LVAWILRIRAKNQWALIFENIAPAYLLF